MNKFEAAGRRIDLHDRVAHVHRGRDDRTTTGTLELFAHHLQLALEQCRMLIEYQKWKDGGINRE
jgi:hypothetical protein